MSRKNPFEVICRYIPMPFRDYIDKLNENEREKISEIRFRVNRPVTVTKDGKQLFITQSGKLSSNASFGIVISYEALNQILNAICSFSIHSYNRELSNGFITIEGGIRAGIAGSIGDYDTSNIKHITSVNFRIPREIKGCSDYIFNKYMSDKPKSMLICGGVASGKTTLLRDLCRNLGNRYTVSLIDERSELAGCCNGIPENDIGVFTDVYDGIDRERGIISSIRSLSPEIIVCDEIGGMADCEAIMHGFGCGVKFAAAAHAYNSDELMKRQCISKLIEQSVFDYIVFLEGSGNAGSIKEIRSLCND